MPWTHVSLHVPRLQRNTLGPRTRGGHSEPEEGPRPPGGREGPRGAPPGHTQGRHGPSAAASHPPREVAPNPQSEQLPPLHPRLSRVSRAETGLPTGTVRAPGPSHPLRPGQETRPGRARGGGAPLCATGAPPQGNAGNGGGGGGVQSRLSTARRPTPDPLFMTRRGLTPTPRPRSPPPRTADRRDPTFSVRVNETKSLYADSVLKSN